MIKIHSIKLVFFVVLIFVSNTLLAQKSLKLQSTAVQRYFVI